MLKCFDEFFDAVTCVLKNNTLPDTSNITDGNPVEGILVVADDCKPIPCESSNMTGALESAVTSTDATAPPTEAATNATTTASLGEIQRQEQTAYKTSMNPMAYELIYRRNKVWGHLTAKHSKNPTSNKLIHLKDKVGGHLTIQSLGF